MTQIITDTNYQDVVTGNPNLVVLDFWAAWCGPCKVLGPIVDELAADYADEGIGVLIGKVDADKNPIVCGTFSIRSIPFIAVLKEGVLVDSHVGLITKGGLKDLIDNYLK